MQLHAAGLIRVTVSLFQYCLSLWQLSLRLVDVWAMGSEDVFKTGSRNWTVIGASCSQNNGSSVFNNCPEWTEFTLIHCHLKSSPSDKVFWRALKVFSSNTLGEEEARIVTFQDHKKLACNAAGMKHVLSIIEVYSYLSIHGCTQNRSSIRYRLELICLSEIISLTQLFVSTSPSPPAYISVLLFLPMNCVYWVCACS